ncbi:MAG: DUF1559 domain-containing protein [Planctomycetes bacterium]|nr:DUF1559 domain-containing protein [Planctomycetota bacterium]
MMRNRLRRRGGRAWVWLLTGLLLGGAIGAGTMYYFKRAKTGPSGPPRLGEATELAMVPADAAGFIHIRARDIWKLETLAEFRKAVDKAGPDSLKILDDGFVPAPSTLDRMTAVFLRSDPDEMPPNFGMPKPPVMLPGGMQLPAGAASAFDSAVVILAFNEPFDAAKVRRTYMPQGVVKTVNGKEVWLDKPRDRSRDLGLHFPDDRIMILGPATGVEHFVANQKDGQSEGPLSASLKMAAEGKRHIAAGFNIKQLGLPEPKFNGADEEFKSVEAEIRTLMKTEAIAVGVAFVPEGTRLDIRAAFKTEAEAAAADAAVRKIAGVVRTKLDDPKQKMKAMLDGKPGQPTPRPIRELPEAVMGLLGVGSMNLLDEYLANPPVKVEGNELVGTFEASSVGGAYVGTTAVAIGLLLPATQKVREAAARMTSSNNLKQIGLAMHGYHDATMKFPQRALMYGPMGTKPGGLSWRVHILPYLEQGVLYNQFKLDEPWDSEHNKKLIPLMPKVYASPTAPATPGLTYYKVFYGPGAAFTEDGQNVNFTNLNTISDGTSNTIMTIEAGAPVTWTKPDDIAFDIKKPLPPLSLNGNPRVIVGMFDGSVRTVDLSKVKPDTMKAAITPAGGEPLGSDWGP